MTIAIGMMISFLWGLSPVIHKTVLNDISPQTALVGVSLFYTICTIVLAWIYRKQIHRDVTVHLTKWNIVFLAFTAIVCGFIANMLYFYMLKHHPSHIVSALIYSSPVFTLLIAYLFLREQISMMGLLGVLLITAGVVCIAFNKNHTK